jgi:hypothetical protein
MQQSTQEKGRSTGTLVPVFPLVSIKRRVVKNTFKIVENASPTLLMAILNIYVKIQLKRTKDKKTYVGLALDRIVQISGAAVDSANFV